MKQYFKLAWENLAHRKKRAYLTILGIFIGIMAVVALVSLGQGLEQGVNAEFAKIGIDKIFVMPASPFGGLPGTGASVLTDRDVNTVRGVSGVKEVVATNYRSAKVEWGDEINFAYIANSPIDNAERALFIESMQTQVERGRHLTNNDKYKAEVGYDYTRRDVYRKTLDLGSTFTINNITFTVVGIRKRIGSSEDDNTITIPASVYQEVVPTNDAYDYIVIQTEPGLLASVVAEKMKLVLQRERNVNPGDEDFSVQTSEDIRASFDIILNIIRAVLVGIAGISLVVGGVGIMNTMYTAVLERTKEIGIMKAVGARNEAVLAIFLIESGLLGLIGGVVGVFLGLTISYVTSIIAAQALGNNLIQAYVSWWLILGSLGFSVIVGMIAGYLPARQAANMNPVDSLRYE